MFQYLKATCYLLSFLFFLTIASFLIALTLNFSQIITEFQNSFQNLPENTLLYDRNSHVYAVIKGLENRESITLNQMGTYMPFATVSIEDARFFHHVGIDPIAIMRALVVNITAQSYRQGASTITQQLAKLLILSPKLTFRRKAQEILSAVSLTIQYDKSFLLQTYLNTIYFGHGLYGIEQASKGYFQKSAKDLNLEQAAFLAAIIKKPAYYMKLPKDYQKDSGMQNGLFPNNILKKTLLRRNYVLKKMYENEWIGQMQYEKALKQQIKVFIPKSKPNHAPYFVQHVRKLLNAKGETVAGSGDRIKTTLDVQMQIHAEQIVQDIFSQPTSFDQIALVALHAKTGEVLALIGGKDFEQSQFNRATQARRQAGSTFKPLIYALALERGISPNQRFIDEPLTFIWYDQAGLKQIYQPQNFDNQYALDRWSQDSVSLQKAFQLSLNTIAVQLLNQVGIKHAVDVLNQMNLKLSEEQGLCLALGCSTNSPLEMTSAYLPFSNQGKYTPPTFIQKRQEPSKLVHTKTIFSKQTAHQMKKLLHQALSQGTGRLAYWEHKGYLGGKTGTSNDYRDAWFIGLADDIITGIWLGNDDGRPTEETGGKTASLIWKKFMKQTLNAL